MSKYNIPFFIVLFCCAAFNNIALGQEVGNDQSLHAVNANMAKAYQKAIGPQSQLYHGPFYDYYKLEIEGTAYFQDSLTFSNGTVKYDGIIYEDVPLLYDEYGQLVVTLWYNNYTKLSLLSKDVSKFDLRGHHFINIQPDELNKKMEPGFYDDVYNNKLQLLVRRVKSLQQDVSTAKKYFMDETSYYLKKAGIYYKVSSKGQLLDVLKDKKKELKQYLKNKNVFFSEDKEQTLLMLVTYYDTISN